jgi:hypothetical protein
LLKFPSIGAFREILAFVKRNCEYHGKALPKIQYEGRVKLHGSNGGIKFDPNNPKLVPQSRERILDPTNDNAGFAAWVARHNDFIHNIFSMVLEGKGKVTVYGEWVGQGIQKNVSISKIEKSFVVFGYAGEDEIYHPFPFFLARQPDALLKKDPHDEMTISENAKLPTLYHIDLVKPVHLEIDFNDPAPAIAEIERLTAAYENECPFAKLFGESGIGEGLVWRPAAVYPEHVDGPRYWFKSKGDKHGNKATVNSPKVLLTPEQINDIKELVTTILPEWRLEQGISKLKENNIPVAKHYTGDYLKWVCGDVAKEEMDTILASGIDVKRVMADVTIRARLYFMNNLEG